MKPLPKLLYIVGIIVIGLSISRWWFIYFDLFKTILGSVIGIGICGVGYFFNGKQNQDIKIQENEELCVKRYKTTQNKIDSLIVELVARGQIKQELVVE